MPFYAKHGFCLLTTLFPWVELTRSPEIDIFQNECENASDKAAMLCSSEAECSCAVLSVRGCIARSAELRLHSRTSETKISVTDFNKNCYVSYFLCSCDEMPQSGLNIRKPSLAAYVPFLSPIPYLRIDLLECGSDFLSTSAPFCDLYAPVCHNIPLSEL